MPLKHFGDGRAQRRGAWARVGLAEPQRGLRLGLGPPLQ